MVHDKPLLLKATLENIEITGQIETGTRSHYSVQLYVDLKEVAKSTHPVPHSSVLTWEWNTGNEIWFAPSSKMKVELYRGLKVGVSNWGKTFVGQYEGKVVNLLENEASFELKDEKGNPIPAEMRLSLSRVSGSVENIQQFMDKVDADVSRLTSNGTVAGTVSTLGQVVKLTKTIMDKVTQAHPILNVSWAVVSTLYEVVQETDIQDESIRGLASTLREMLGTANAIPNLPVIPETTDVIEAISRQSLEVASLVHEYTRLSRAGRIVKNQVPGGLKSRIEACQKSCATMKDAFHLRVNVDTNTQVKENGRNLEAIVDHQQAEKIRKWLSPPDSSKILNDAREKRQTDTCSWFLNGERFREWTAKPGFLWISGKVGSGKSILCSSVIDHLRNESSAPAYAYLFFDGSGADEGLQRHNKLIRSLIVQFTHQRGGIPSTSELAGLYTRCGDYQQPSLKGLQKVLRDITHAFSDAYIVIDALDECIDRKDTLTWLNDLVSTTDTPGGNLHIMVTSRPERDIEEGFKSIGPNPVDISASAENLDIIQYLACQMESEFFKYDESIRKKIESDLRERADGSFQWVALQIAELKKCLSETQIYKQLKDLPKGVEDTYERILKAVDRKYREDMKTFLEWLAFSRRPMTITEVAEAVTVQFDEGKDPMFNIKNRYYNPEDVLVRCSSLVSKSGGFIKLSHFSVKEYLLSSRVEDSFRINEETAQLRISEISVVYLLQLDSLQPVPRAMLSAWPLAKYAAMHWIDHVKAGRMEPILVQLILRLFAPDSAAFTNWIQIYNANSSNWQPEPDIPLYWASQVGLQQVSELLLENGADVNAAGGFYGNALQAASARGHEAIVKVLLENGADVNAVGGYYGNALQAASFGGHEAIVKVLLENGADVNVVVGEFNSALQAASFGGHETIVKMLLENGADVNAEGGFYGNALQAASAGGYEAIMTVLLENGADVNAVGGWYGDALQAASAGGHEAIIKILLENGSDVNAVGGYYSNALQAASFKGHTAIVKVLLENGADLNAGRGYYGSALQAASVEGHGAIVKVLLENGSDVNAVGGFYSNALQAASFGGHEAIVKVLLENGADVNVVVGQCGNALQAASVEGHEAIVKVLLENGLDVNTVGGVFGNALQAASFGGHEAVVKVLLENGSDVNAVGGVCGNALQAASFVGHETIVKVLLENGAEVNALHEASQEHRDAIMNILLESLEDGDSVDERLFQYGNALQAASGEDHKSTVKVLLEHGADANAQGGHYGNALQAASFQGHEAIVKVLLDDGADVNAVGGHYGSALQAASFGDHEETVEVLLENGADVDVQGGEYGTALQAASEAGNKQIIQMLLKWQKSDSVAVVSTSNPGFQFMPLRANN